MRILSLRIFTFKFYPNISLNQKHLKTFVIMNEIVKVIKILILKMFCFLLNLFFSEFYDVISNYYESHVRIVVVPWKFRGAGRSGVHKLGSSTQGVGEGHLQQEEDFSEEGQSERGRCRIPCWGMMKKINCF